MEFNKELEKAGSDVEIITAYDRIEAERLVGHEQGFYEGLEKGREEGLKQSIEQGAEQNHIEIAKRMLQKDIKLDEVHSLIPEISLQDLKKIKEDLDNKHREEF